MSKQKAVSLLTHYFQTAFKAAGLKWDSDNDMEMEQIVDEILEGVKVGK
jgi:hypothetical protein